MPRNNFPLAAEIKLPSHHGAGGTCLPSLESKNSPGVGPAPQHGTCSSSHTSGTNCPYTQPDKHPRMTDLKEKPIAASSHGNFTAFCITVPGYLDSPWYQIKQVAWQTFWVSFRSLQVLCCLLPVFPGLPELFCFCQHQHAAPGQELMAVHAKTLEA